jgi:putative flippase GtrA
VRFAGPGPVDGSADRRRQVRGAWAGWYAQTMAAIVARLPFGLDTVVAPSLLGFALINGLTFGLDLTLLTALHGGLRWPLALSITLSYLTAFAVSFLLNRAFNFRSHAPVGPQLTVYLGVVAINYLVWILGVGTGLAALGLEYQLARIVAGAGEAVYMYLALRFVVFRPARAT